MTKTGKQNVKAKILSAAEALFAHRGFDATGIDAIAKKAGITKSLIYYYFKSKDDILSELFDNFGKKSVEAKHSITDIWRQNPELTIEDIIRQYSLPFMMQFKNIIKIAFTESLKDAPENPHVNIFRYFEQNFQAGYQIAERHGVRYEDKPATSLAGFFLIFAPLFSFTIFSDEWCEHYRMDMETTTEIFIKAFAKMYRTMLSQSTGKESLGEILQTDPIG